MSDNQDSVGDFVGSLGMVASAGNHASSAQFWRTHLRSACPRQLTPTCGAFNRRTDRGRLSEGAPRRRTPSLLPPPTPAADGGRGNRTKQDFLVLDRLWVGGIVISVSDATAANAGRVPELARSSHTGDGERTGQW